MFRAPLCAALLAALAGCGAEPETARPGEPGAGAPREGPPHADWSTVDTLREDLAAERHASDGGGRAWLEAPEAEPPRAVAGRPGSFRIVYEVGPLGIARGGAIHLQLPFWSWGTPQAELPEAPGYTTVEPLGAPVELEVETLDDMLLAIRVVGRPLEPGERLRIHYGAGELGARADRFAEHGSRFWIAVDGDGDGVRAFLTDSPAVDVAAGPPAQLRLTAPSVARPGEELDLVIAILDASGNAGVVFEGEIALGAEPGWPGLPGRIRIGPGDAGRARVRVRAPGPGVFRVSAGGPEGLAAESNPLVVSASGPRILWGDLHGHSNLSDGTGTPEDYFLYARDVAALDVVALTDHDHWGVMKLDAHPEMWAAIGEQVRRFHEPGRFVTLLGYEWTSWIHGHRHVLYFSDEGPLLSSMDPATESPAQLWAALEGQEALTFAHHSAGGPIPVNWEFPPDPRFEPVTEIASVHGSSEALDSPFPIYSPVPGNSVRDVLDRGYRLGFIGSGDSHDGHPGLAQLAAPSAGLAAIVAEHRTREAVLAALRARRSYATNGPRIVLRCALGPHAMGEAIPAPPDDAPDESLYVHVISPGPLERLDLVRSGRVVEPSLALEGRREVEVQRPVADLVPGEYLYVRVVQEDGGAAWSSPFFVE